MPAVNISSAYVENAFSVCKKRPQSLLELKKWIAHNFMSECQVRCISPLEKKKIFARQAMLAEQAADIQCTADDETKYDVINDNIINGFSVKVAGGQSDDDIGLYGEKCKSNLDFHEDMEVLGPHSKFPISARALGDINWSSASHATRALLTAVFPREVLATHSLSGRPSPAFPKKPAKRQLEPLIIKDIINLVKEKCGVKEEKKVRAIITTKCADEGKMLRLRQRNEKTKHLLRRKINPPSRYSPEQ